MLRRLYLLVLLLALVCLSLLYLWKYGSDPALPGADRFRTGVELCRDTLPTAASAGIDRSIGLIEERIDDIRWAFLGIFALFYLQFFLRRRPPLPADERRRDLERQRRWRSLRKQITVLFVATLLLSLVVLAIELLARAPHDRMVVLGYVIDRGEPHSFRRSVYHWGLILALLHLFAYIVWTWLALALGARRDRKSRRHAAVGETAAAKAG